MKVADKVAAAKREIVFISRHDDADPSLINKVLDSLTAFIAEEKEEMVVRRAKKVEADLEPTPAPSAEEDAAAALRDKAREEEMAKSKESIALEDAAPSKGAK